MQTVEEQLYEIGTKVLQQAHSQLYLSMRYLEGAFSAFSYEMRQETDPFGTDGAVIYFHPSHLGGLYQQDRILVNRGYLHLVLHCLFRHLWTRGDRDQRVWNLSCDIAVESMIDQMVHPCVKRARSVRKRETYHELEKTGKVESAQNIYYTLMKWKLSEETLQKLEEEFRVDDHVWWERPDQKKRQEMNQNWQDQAEKAETDLQTFSKEASDQAGNLEELLTIENNPRHSYREFLKKFSVLAEEPGIDPDTFDYGFYSYGLRMYGNMPLIEPQETREVKRMREFVIAIDTSMSCSGKLVQRFLEETYTILSEAQNFYGKVQFRILQCDESIQDEAVITTGEELKNYMEHLELKGGGGTDFRPVFERVEELVRDHVFENLRGMLYFTDGYGVYPKKMPPFETAFIFLEEDYQDREVPPWAIRLVLREEELLPLERSNTE